jgi:cell wall assembly regulator SMI1
MSATDEVNAAFARIVKWLTAHKKAKAILPSFNKPATDAAIKQFAAKTKLALPEGLVAIYRLLDGQDEDRANEANQANGDSIESGLFPSIESDDLAFLFVPLKELQRQVLSSSRMPGFRKGWLPFGDNYGGDNVVLDLASDEPKKRGRVLQFNHEYGGAYPLSASFEAYLTDIADGLESRKIVWDEDSGLSYKKSRDWDDLIEKKKVEYDPEFMKEFGGDS